MAAAALSNWKCGGQTDGQPLTVAGSATARMVAATDRRGPVPDPVQAELAERGMKSKKPCTRSRKTGRMTPANASDRIPTKAH